MGIALTIGIMFVIFGVVGWMQNESPCTFLGDTQPQVYGVVGVIILISCLIYYLIS